MRKLLSALLCLCALCLIPMGSASAQAHGTANGFDLGPSLTRRLAAEIAMNAALARQRQAQGQQEQEPADGVQAAQEEEPGVNIGLFVFLDCDRRVCDQDYLRQNITFINYVRDREDAQIQILVTTQFAAAGFEFTFDFIGLEEFEGDDLRLTWMSSNTNTQDERREGVAQMIRAGVVHYIAKTPLIHNIEIRQIILDDVDQRFLVVDPSDDPWNFWVMRLSLSGEVGGEDRRSNYNLRFNASANRTTEDWKIRFVGNFRNDERTFILNDGSESIGLTRAWTFYHQTVKSLSEHWGLSGKAAVWSNTFTNHGRVITGAPGIEYNIFPYSESSRRIFTFTYEVGVSASKYFEETIFEMTEETLFDHSGLVNLDVVQPWGELEGGVTVLQYLNYPDQWSARLNGRIEFRVIRGLSFNVRGNWAAVRNQRFLPAEGQTDEEILLRQGALATNSEYEVNFGVTFQFGSIFNNVVNPRFTDSRSGFGSLFAGGGGRR